jgi:hypothetical protein
MTSVSFPNNSLLVPPSIEKDYKADPLTTQPTQESRIGQVSKKTLPAEAEPFSRKRLRKDEPQGAPPSKISKQDPLIEYESALLLTKIFNQEFSLASAEELPLVIQEEAQRFFLEFETDAQNTGMSQSQIQAVKKKVEERIKCEIDQLLSVDPQVIDALWRQISNAATAFSLISYPKGLEQFEDVFTKACHRSSAHFLRGSALNGLKLMPYIQKILELPQCLQKKFLQTMVAICGPCNSVEEISECNSEFCQSSPEDSVSEETMNLLAKRIVAQKKAYEKDWELLKQECREKVPSLLKYGKSDFMLAAVKTVVAEISSGRLHSVLNDELVWLPLLGQVSVCLQHGFPLSTQLIKQYANNVHKLHTLLKEKFSLPHDEAEAIVFKCCLIKSIDPKNAIHALQAVKDEDTAKMTQLLQTHFPHSIFFLMNGGNLALYRKLERHEVFKYRPISLITWTKEMVDSLKAFSPNEWVKLSKLLPECSRFEPLDDLVFLTKPPKEVQQPLS